MPARASRAALIALAVTLAVAGCSADAGAPRRAAGPEAAPSPSAAPTDAAPTARAGVAELPESALRTIWRSGYTPAADDTTALTSELATRPDLWAGYVARDVEAGGVRIGTVRLLRVVPAHAADAPAALDRILAAFTTAPSVETAALDDGAGERTVAGTRVRLAETGAGGVAGGVAAWTDGADLLLLSSVDAPWALSLATSYLTGDPITTP